MDIERNKWFFIRVCLLVLIFIAGNFQGAPSAPASDPVIYPIVFFGLFFTMLIYNILGSRRIPSLKEQWFSDLDDRQIKPYQITAFFSVALGVFICGMLLNRIISHTPKTSDILEKAFAFMGIRFALMAAKYIIKLRKAG